MLELACVAQDEGVRALAHAHALDGGLAGLGGGEAGRRVAAVGAPEADGDVVARQRVDCLLAHEGLGQGLDAAAGQDDLHAAGKESLREREGVGHVGGAGLGKVVGHELAGGAGVDVDEVAGANQAGRHLGDCALLRGVDVVLLGNGLVGRDEVAVGLCAGATMDAFDATIGVQTDEVAANGGLGGVQGRAKLGQGRGSTGGDDLAYACHAVLGEHVRLLAAAAGRVDAARVGAAAPRSFSIPCR